MPILSIKLETDINFTMKKFAKSSTIGLREGIYCLLILIATSFSAFSQSAGISPANSVPNPAAGLDVNYTNKGLLIPRVALTSTSAFAPLTAHVAGMIVYNTATTGDVTPGLYYNNGTKWVVVLSKANNAGDMQYWDGTAWKTIPTGQPGQKLQINGSGVPVWGP
jgi:hypothetical protein